MILATYNVLAFAQQPVEACYPAIDNSLPQYIVGYGSLMQTKSKSTTHPNTGENMPVMIKGYKRGWFAKGSPIGPSTTFLGVLKDEKTELNGIIFELSTKEGMQEYDKRESFYCRVLITPEKIKMLNEKSIPNGQLWIYVIQPQATAKPSKKYPIVQSYVDVFMSGCLEVQEKYNIKTFASDCIDTTHDWSAHWINDRPVPRRPWVHEPKATKIDELLSSKLNKIFTQIKIE
jgi:hypothetical protein